MITRRRFLQGLAVTPALPYIGKLNAVENPCKDIVVENLYPYQKEIYVEVSARRSGKTRRLVHDMMNYIDATDKDVYFISPNHRMRQYVIEDYISKNYHSKIKDPMQDLKNGIVLMFNERFYYDEFLMLPYSYQDIIQYVTDNGYYVGTPGTPGKTKFFTRLMEKTNNNYVSYRNGSFII